MPLSSAAFLATIATAITLVVPSTASRADTEITYQGELTENGALADGAFDMSFSLWDALAGGAQIGSTIAVDGVQVTEGRFTVELDFGAEAFDNSARWLEITVGADTLFPRQPITRTPYAIQTRGIQVNEDEHVGMGVIPGNERLRVWNLEGPAFQAIAVDGRAIEAITTDADIALLASNQTGDGIGVFGQNQPNGNWGYLGSESYGVLGRATDPITEWAGYFEGRGYFSNYTLIGRQDRVTQSEFFGVSTPAADQQYGGMYMDTSGAGGWPFYGYATDGRSRMWHYYDGQTDKWHIHNGSTRVTVTGDGHMGVGTQDPGARIEAINNGAANVIAIRGVSLGSDVGQYGVWGQSNAVNGSGVLGFAPGGSGVRYGVQGNCGSPTGFDFYASGAGINYGSVSSRRWKFDITPIQNPLGLIRQLNGVTFTWDAEHGGHRDIGMIAEEVGELLPEVVSYEDNGTDALGMDYTKLTPLLVEALKRLDEEKTAELSYANSRISRLERDNEKLEARVEALEKLVEQALTTNTSAKTGAK